MATLREQSGALSAMIADPGEKRVFPAEKIAYLNMAQTAIEGMLWDIDRTKFSVIQKITAVAGTSDYAVASDVRDIQRVEYRGFDCTRLAQRDSGVRSYGPAFQPAFGNNQFFEEIGQDSLGKTQIRIYPTPTTLDGDLTDAIKVWYYKTTRRLHELGIYNGKVTTTGNLTQWFDIQNPFYGSGWDFWKNNAIVRWTKGPNTGQARLVTGYTASTGLFQTAAVTNTIVANTHEYICDQFSGLPRQYHHLVTLYAASLAAKKAKIDGGVYMKQCKREIDMIRFNYEHGIDAAMPGMNYGSTAPYSQGVPR